MRADFKSALFFFSLSRETTTTSTNDSRKSRRRLTVLPADAVIDDELVTLEESGRPVFHRLQHFTAEASANSLLCFVQQQASNRSAADLEETSILPGT
jgi:hypothetical protein